MKKVFLLLFLAIAVIGGVFAESTISFAESESTMTTSEEAEDAEEAVKESPKYQSDYKKMSVDITIESPIPFSMPQEFSSDVNNIIAYIIAFSSLRTSYQYGFLSTSDYLNLGFGIDVFLNPIAILDKENFFGGFGFSFYNDFVFNNIILSPYVKTDLVFAVGSKVGIGSFFDFSAGANASFGGFFMDLYYNTAIVNLTENAPDYHFNAHAIRIGLGYTKRM